MNNLVEYALAGRNPAAADGSAGTFTGNLLSFAKRTDATGISYLIQESDDVGMTDGWVAVTPTTDNPTTITYALPESARRRSSPIWRSPWCPEPVRFDDTLKHVEIPSRTSKNSRFFATAPPEAKT